MHQKYRENTKHIALNETLYHNHVHDQGMLSVWVSFNPHFSSKFVLISPKDRIQCPYKTDDCMFLLVGQHLYAHE